MLFAVKTVKSDWYVSIRLFLVKSQWVYCWQNVYCLSVSLMLSVSRLYGARRQVLALIYSEPIRIQRRAKPYSPNPPVYGLIRRVTTGIFTWVKRCYIFVCYFKPKR